MKKIIVSMILTAVLAITAVTMIAPVAAYAMETDEQYISLETPILLLHWAQGSYGDADINEEFDIPAGMTKIYISYEHAKTSIEFRVHPYYPIRITKTATAGTDILEGMEIIEVFEGETIVCQWLGSGMNTYAYAEIVGYTYTKPAEPQPEYEYPFVVCMSYVSWDYEEVRNQYIVPDDIIELSIYISWQAGIELHLLKNGVSIFKTTPNLDVTVTYTTRKVTVTGGDIISCSLGEPLEEVPFLYIKIEDYKKTDNSVLVPEPEPEPEPQPDFDYSFMLRNNTTATDYIVPEGVTALFIYFDFSDCGLTLKKNGTSIFSIYHISSRTHGTKYIEVSAGDRITSITENFGGGSSVKAEITGYSGTEITEYTPEPEPNNNNEITPVTLSGEYTFAEVIDGELVVNAPIVIPQGVTKIYLTFNGNGTTIFELRRNGMQVSSYTFSNWAGNEIVFEYNVTAGDIVTLTVMQGDSFTLTASTEEPETVTPPTDNETDGETDNDKTPSDFFDGIRDFFNDAGGFFENMFSSTAGVGFGGTLLVVLLAIVVIALWRKK